MRYAVAILLALTTPASAQDTTTANQMLPGCKGLLDNRMTSGVSVYQQGRCGGYVAGLVYGEGGQEFCSPKGVSIGQAVAVVIKYIEARPERIHEPFGKLALEALEEAWPCKR
jgi:Rap1a immunity proteins